MLEPFGFEEFLAYYMKISIRYVLSLDRSATLVRYRVEHS